MEGVPLIFSFFDAINYDAKTIRKNSPSLTKNLPEVVPMTDIFRNYRAYFDKVAKNYILRTYYIAGSPRPEELAHILYGNSQLYWVILMCNNIYDPYWGWITNQEACYQSAIQRYQDVGGNKTIYHINDKGEKFWNLVSYPEAPTTWYDKGDLNKQYPQYQGDLAAIDSLENAIRENEYKRQIKIISPNDIQSFINSLIREMEKASK